jgi:hypothetical protein
MELYHLDTFTLAFAPWSFLRVWFNAMLSPVLSKSERAARHLNPVSKDPWRAHKVTRAKFLFCSMWRLSLTTCLLLIFLLPACSSPQVKQGQITVTVNTAEGSSTVKIAAGSTVQDAITAAKITLGELDRSEPPFYTVLADGSKVQVIKVSEEFKVEQVEIPFERQTVRNEDLPEGETRLVQAGVNGLEEITYRQVFENGAEVSTNPVKSVVVKEAVPEIMMVGSRAPFAAFDIPGTLAYLSGGNAWVMTNSTGDRRPVVTSSKLDGRVFSLAPDKSWLLFTQRAGGKEVINSLWAAQIEGQANTMADLKVNNVVHFADWIPNSVLRIAYSTVEPREAAPGWQANNDLILLNFSANGWLSKPVNALEASTGGVYGWWGTNFIWSPNGSELAYARPDGIGLVDIHAGTTASVMEINPYQTFGDWAWVPGVSWSPDGKMLYTVDHVNEGNNPASGSAETSPIFDVVAMPLFGASIHLVTQAGMFAYPVASPLLSLASGENAYQVAYLQAIFPTQSETSRYKLVVMDRDGSNKRTIFPPEGMPGMEPQQVIWSPQPLPGSDSFSIAVLYQGNIWLVDVNSGQARQLTGEGVVSKIDWK